MKYQSYIYVFTFLTICAFGRVWTARDGRETEADLIKYDAASGELVLKQKDGQEFKLNRSALSNQDIHYLEDVEKKQLETERKAAEKRALAEKNLIKNGDFEQGVSRWNKDANIVFETPEQTNKVCRLEINEEQKYEFSQKIITKEIDYLKLRYRLKKSSDYSGGDLYINFKGTGRGFSRSLPRNSEWNIQEWKSLDLLDGKSYATVIFSVGYIDSGSLSVDDIVLVEDHEYYQ